MKRILILNWRDPKSPLEGGAERFTKKYAEYWAEQGNKVYWLTNSFKGSKNKETINKVEYIRVSPSLNGRLISYIFKYPIFLIKSIIEAKKIIKKQNIDIIIDEIHGLPFFSPLFSKKRNILLTCEVAGPIWDKMFPFPINVFGKLSEKLIYRLYENTEIWAISNNTKKNIQELIPQKAVSLIGLGIDQNVELLNKLSNSKKTKYPSAVFLARLVKMKGIETALLATAKIIITLPNFQLFVVGDSSSSYKLYLKDLVAKLGIVNNVKFMGKVSELDKYKYLKQAHFLIHPSFKEGFGLTIIEAGLVGTPSIVRKGSSMDRLIKNNKNGYVFSFDSEIVDLYIKGYQKQTYANLAQNAVLNAKKYF